MPNLPLPDDVKDELARLQQLLEWERQESEQRARDEREGKTDNELVQKGVLAKRLMVASEEAALFGRTRWTLVPRHDAEHALDLFDVRAGAVVRFRADDSDAQTPPARGVVIRRTARSLMVVLDEVPDDVDTDQVVLEKLEDEVSLRRMADTLRKWGNSDLDKRQVALLQVVLGLKAPGASEAQDVAFIDDKLNADQQLAVQKALGAPDVGLIHGPPGTGKTRTVVEVIRQLHRRGERVLCLCASNAAVDHVALEVLAQDATVPLARSGHPARVHDQLMAHTLAGLTDEHELRKLSKKLLEEAYALLRNVRKRSDRAGDARQRRREAKKEAGGLFADARRLERQAVAEVLRKTRVLCGTLTGFAREISDDERFDVLVVDEASQALTPALLLALARVDRVVLAGDHKQLPPTVQSPKAEREGLGFTTFDRCMSRDDADAFGHMLTVQHRMHEQLMRFSSDRFYDGRLTAHPSVAQHTLHDVDVDAADFGSDVVFEFIDSAGAGWEESDAVDSASRKNDDEAQQVVRVVRAMVDAGLAVDDIGVVTPYAAQSSLLSQLLHDEVEQGLEVDSVDGFQGREKELIVMSCVRSNPLGTVGFLSDVRRLNVALTRARRKLVVVGDSATLSNDSNWAALVDHAIASGGHRSAFEFMSFD